jgi:5'-nucleotidase (lipoprotein e(P4) family)
MMRHYALALALGLIGCAPTGPQNAQPATVSSVDVAGKGEPSIKNPPAPFATLQWLYGSGEGAATSIQAYRVLQEFAVAASRARPRNSVVLAEGGTLSNPGFIPCGNRPLAVILDVDETALQNLGYQYERDVEGVGYTDPSWDSWERTGAANVLPMPGAVDAIQAMRAAGITVVFNTNRLSGNASSTEAALNAAGLGPVRHRDTLWLKGDAPGGSLKDSRRALISQTYCVIAMAGDQLGDFSDLFKLPVHERRSTAASAPIAKLWGNGWFVLSNPVYGSALAGTREEIFPPEMRWSDPDANN